MSESNLPGKRYELPQEKELRVEVSANGPLRLQLVSGTAEIFGTEVPPSFWLNFSPEQKIAVFTWTGAAIQIDGKADVVYVADETPMTSYLNVHAVLNNRRKRAREAASAFPTGPDETPNPLTQGPRVMVVGPTDSGKSSLVKMLLGWATREQWVPMYVDLDVGQGSITIPGVIAATPVQMPIDPVEGLVMESPLAYFFGHATPSVNIDLYKSLVKDLAHALDFHLASNAVTRNSGMIINTMGWVEGDGYDLLLQAIDALNTNVILVLGQEKVYSMLHDHLRSKPGVDVVKLSKSGGVVPRDQKYRQKSRVTRCKSYFYGRINQLSPHSFVASFSDFQVFRFGGGPQAPRSALPIGAERTADPTRATPINFSRDLVHTIVAISFATDPDQLISSNVAGFLHIKDVDLVKKNVTFLAPCPGPLPGNLLIAGNLLWMEENALKM